MAARPPRGCRTRGGQEGGARGWRGMWPTESGKAITRGAAHRRPVAASRRGWVPAGTRPRPRLAGWAASRPASASWAHDNDACAGAAGICRAGSRPETIGRCRGRRHQEPAMPVRRHKVPGWRPWRAALTPVCHRTTEGTGETRPELRHPAGRQGSERSRQYQEESIPHWQDVLHTPESALHANRPVRLPVRRGHRGGRLREGRN